MSGHNPTTSAYSKGQNNGVDGIFNVTMTMALPFLWRSFIRHESFIITTDIRWKP